MLAFTAATIVVLIAGGTFAVGRYLFQRRGGDPAPVAAHRPLIESTEENPEDSGSQPPTGAKRSRPSAKIVVMQEGSGDVNLTPATAALTGEVKLTPTGSGERLNGWSQPGDEAAWTFKLLEPGFFELEVTYAALDEAGEIVVTALLNDEELKTFSFRPTRSLDQWSTRQQTVAIPVAGQNRLALRLESEMAAGSLSLKHARLMPARVTEKQGK